MYYQTNNTFRDTVFQISVSEALMIAILHRGILIVIALQKPIKYMRWSFFVTVNGYTIFAKSSLLDVLAGSDYASAL